MVKENDGKAKRKMLMRKVTIVASACGAILVLTLFLGGKPPRPRRGTAAYSALQEAQRKQHADQLRKRAHERFKDSLGVDSPNDDDFHAQHPNFSREEMDSIQQIVSGQMALVEIQIQKEFYTHHKKNSWTHNHHHDSEVTYNGVIGSFCQVNFQAHKNDPSKVPMFRDILEASPDCKEKVKLNLQGVVSIVREHDRRMKIIELEQQHEGQEEEEREMEEEEEEKEMEGEEEEEEDGGEEGGRHKHHHHKKKKKHYKKKKHHTRESGKKVKTMEPKGFVFHESRCGSTLVANSLMAMNPTQHRVYSESPPPVAALKSCGETYEKCPRELAVALFQDVIFLMGRTVSDVEENLFFKIQSVGTRNISVFRQAFPDTPWIFVYRDPVQVLASQLKAKDMTKTNCVRSKYSNKNNQNGSIDKYLEVNGLDKDEMTDEDYCAVHLATITESALHQLAIPGAHGLAVNYEGLVDSLMDHIIPDHFGVPVGEEERKRITDISAVYSKGRGKKAGMNWEEDSEAKEERATPQMHDAAESYLQSSYEGLQSLAVNSGHASSR